MRRSRKSISIIMGMILLLIIVMVMDMLFVFQMTSRQTKETGTYQLTSFSGAFAETINAAESLTMQLTLQAQFLIQDRGELRSFLYAKRDELAEEGNGGYNIFVAGTGWDIIPGLIKPKDFVGTERTWYTGAYKNAGSPYVTPPYVDLLTGNICYTVSVLMGDGDTVLGVDYTMENIQAHIKKMYDNGTRNAVIVTEDGIIAGCSDESLLGESLIQALPDYAGIFSLAKSREGVVTNRIRSDVLYDNLFATKAGNGWVLIVSEGDWELYKESYIQFFVTILFSLFLFGSVFILYIIASKNRKSAEAALSAREEFLAGITSELREPLQRILKASEMEYALGAEDYEKNIGKIHSEGNRISEMVEQMVSYPDRQESREKGKKGRRKKRQRRIHVRMNARFRAIIIVFLVVVMCISLYINIAVTCRWGNVSMKSEVESYEYQLSEWINTQKSILDFFCSVIATNPEMLQDYEGTVEYLDKITKHYPEISVSYMTNPELEHTVYMNNGWEPDEDWHVEERQWYIDTLAAKDGWSISTPYYDEQTGLYCVTISEQVLDAKTGEFLGNFGIDFYMDKLVEILGNSYSDTGYAFLVDAAGDIINHPYGKYQMSVDNTTNVSELSYSGVKADGKRTLLFRDYDGTRKILIATRNQESNFTVYVVSSVWKIYGRVLVYGGICFITFMICIFLVYRILTNLIHWQDKTNEQMKEAADTAIAAGKAKSQFLAQMSHEIRTPINAVLGMNEMILREAGDEAILDYASNIQTAGRTLLALINSILDFSKIEDGKMEIIPVKYDLASVIHNLVNSISERATGKGLEVAVKIDENLPSMLLGDDVRISQVIMNLLTNAVKYTEEGTVTFRMYGGERDGNTIELCVEVCDTGIGIREEDMEKLFESFERLEEKRNRNIEGTGLGMSIVTKLLKMMGSELHVESVYGEGSVFSFRLKQEIIDESPVGNYAERLAESHKQQETGSRLHVEGASVLVTDDNSMNLKVAKNLMKLCGILPDLASSGYETIEMIQKKHYDIVFLDHMMPKMDGIETLEKIRKENLLGENVTVIALTANAIVGAKETYLKAGFDDYLSKPIEIPDLEKKLVKYLPKEMISYQQEENSGGGILEVSAGAAEEGEVLEFSPEKTGDEEILEFSPEETGDGEILEFSPEASEEEFLEFSPQQNGENLEKSSEKILDALEKLEINTKDGLRYCANDVIFYMEMLKEYREACSSRKEELVKAYSEEDWSSYQIYAHALKSTSKSIGAEKIFQMAKGLEEAAKEKNAVYIREHHEELISLYEKIADDLEKTFA